MSTKCLMKYSRNFESESAKERILKQLENFSESPQLLLTAIAAGYGSINIVKSLTSDREHEKGWNIIIMEATFNGHLDIVKYMSSKVENPNSAGSDEGMFPLHVAANLGHIDIFKFLYCHSKCKLKNDPDSRHGLTAIHWAAASGHIAIIKFLADKVGNNPNMPVTQNTAFNGFMPLHFAAFRGHLDVVKFIALRMGNPNIRTQIPYGWTPIELAAQGLHSEIVSYITELQDIHSQWSNRSQGNEIHVLHGNPWNWNW